MKTYTLNLTWAELVALKLAAIIGKQKLRDIAIIQNQDPESVVLFQEVAESAIQKIKAEIGE
jgi:hypothetical protein